MSNNFKDDFEKNRQSIDTNSHQDHIEDVEKDQAEVEHQDTTEKTEQQFPPRNAQRRKRRRDLATNHNKQEHQESQVSEDKVQNEAGTLDDRQDESSLHSSLNQEVSHHESKPHNDESNYTKNAFAMDKSHPEPNEENVKHEEAQEKRDTKENKSVANNVENEKVQQPKPHFSTDANKSKESEENSNDVSLDSKNNDTKENHNVKKAAAIGAGTAGVAGAIGGASKANHHAKDQQNAQKDSIEKSTESKEAKKKEKDYNNKKGAAVGAGTAGAVGASAAASKQQASAQTNHNHEHRDHHDKKKDHKKGGMTKVLLPLIAAVLIVGALAIFGGMALNNHNNGTKENKIANTNKNKSDDNKDKATSTDSAKDKSKSEDNDKSKSDDKDKATTDESNNNQNTANQANNQTQNNQNQQQANQNQQQQRQGGGQRHTVSGQENLYRIAIQYYGSGSPENVEKIRRANGLSGNNIRNGQQIIIP
ncbi:elastin-binding protein EbpS [Staphylococcus argenteus]|uniref:elastin-binding protein EbpS n=1 Tax=Staphylococcus argenteus TaxID=985002 RepID=UPI0009133757|nr:elastin-binding protein EbpS [Staphylococcus argenteus]SHD48836.1 cell surface elastin binding protein [Staphylococcus argenteus]